MSKVSIPRVRMIRWKPCATMEDREEAKDFIVDISACKFMASHTKWYITWPQTEKGK